MTEADDTKRPHPSPPEQPDSGVSGVSGVSEMTDAYGALLGADGSFLEDLDDLVGPTFWPAMAAGDVEVEWAELREWVEHLVERFPHLDHHVVPACWYRHNGHVEALVALRDHEKVSYADSSPATSPAQWHQVFALIESRLREWTAQAGCMSTHREPPARLPSVDDDEWDRWVAHDKKRRLTCYVATQPAP